MKMYKALISFFSLLLVILMVFFLADRFISGISFSDIAFFQSRKESVYTIEEEIKDLYQLNTSEYRIKLIFPFDFVDRDIDWREIKQIYERDLEPTEPQIKDLAIYQSSLNAGIDPAVDLYDFIIVTAVVKAGIYLGNTVEEIDLNSLVTIQNREDNKTISLHIPDMRITDYYIEDRRPDKDNFPDAKLTPGQWRDLVDFINPLIVEKVIQLGILDNARKNSQLLMEKILMDSGFSEVYFTGLDL